MNAHSRNTARRVNPAAAVALANNPDRNSAGPSPEPSIRPNEMVDTVAAMKVARASGMISVSSGSEVTTENSKVM